MPLLLPDPTDPSTWEDAPQGPKPLAAPTTPSGPDPADPTTWEDAAPAPQDAVQPDPNFNPLYGAWAAARGQDPDHTAKVLTLALQAGLPAATVERNLAEVEADVKDVRLEDLDHLATVAPKASTWLAASPDRFAMSRDDLGNIANFEALLAYKNPGPAVNRATGLDWLVKAGGQTLESSVRNLQINALRVKQLYGDDSPETEAAIQRLKAQQPDRVATDGLLQDAYINFLDLAPQFIGQANDRIKYGLMGAAVGGAAGAPVGGVGAAPGAVAGFALGQQLGGARNAFEMEAGAAYDEYRMLRDERGQPLDDRTARLAATLVGVVNGGIEFAQMNLLLKMIPGGDAIRTMLTRQGMKEALAVPAIRTALTNFAKNLAGGWTLETGQEILQEAVTFLGRQGVLWANDQGTDSMKDFTGRMADTAYQAGTGMFPLVGFHAALGLRGDFKRARAAKADAFLFEALDENAKASKLRARMPEAYQDLAAALTKGGPVEAVHVDAATFQQAAGLEGEPLYQLLDQIGVKREDFDQAARVGADIAIPLDRYQARLAGTDVSLALRPDLKFQPDGMTLREQAEFEKALPERIKAVQEAFKADLQGQADLDTATTGFEQQLVDAGYTKEGAAFAAQLLKQRAQRAAVQWSAATGEPMTPAQWITDHLGLRVETVEPGADGRQDTQAFHQDHPAMAGVDMNDAAQVAEAQRLWAEMGTESPYFKKWSGGAPVVTDASAKGNIVDTERLWRDKQYMKTLEGYAAAERARLEKDIAAEQAWWEANVKDPANPTAEEMNSALDMGIIPPINNNWDAVREQASTSLAGYEKQIAEMAPTIKDREGKTEIFQTGKPVVVRVFHATPFGELSGGAFDPQFLGKNTKAGSATLAYFFAGTEDTAGAYAKGDIINQRGFLSMSPADKTALIDGLGDHLRDQGVFDEDEYVHADDVARWAEENPRDVKEYAESYILPDNEEYDPRPVEPKTYELYVNLKNPLVYDFKGERYRETSYFDILKKAKDAGHDGAVFLNTYDGGPKDNIFAVFPGHEIQIKSVFNRGTFDGSDPRILMQSAASVGATPDARAEYFKNSKVRDKDGNLKVLFHGAKRADRINEAEKFSKDRATSGPMAFFTDDPEIASGYASGKQDTSLKVESLEPFFVVNGKKDFKSAWYSIDPLKRFKIKKMAHRIGQNEETGAIEIVMRDGDKNAGLAGRQHFEYELKRAGGNAIKALYEMWVNSGTIFGEERRFVEVLRVAGIEDVVFNDPYAEFPGVFPVYLNITNPLDTSAIPKKVVAALRKAAKQNPDPEYMGGVDEWDKRGPRGSGENWFPDFERGLKEGDTLAWTVVPDWVTETLKSLGYDGIKDTGGKQGGRGHEVWIPFEENQVKSVFNQNPTRDPRILMQSAFHGSPYRFDKFSLEHIGSGEGAQAYGYGLYFAGKKEVAEWYRKTTAGQRGGVTVSSKFGELKTDRHPDKNVQWAGEVIKQAAREIGANSGTITADTLSLAEKKANELEKFYILGKNDAAEVAALVKKWSKSGTVVRWAPEAVGQLYEVEIPDDEHLMLWDKPLSEQPKAVKKALENASLEMRGKTYNLKEYVDASGDNTFTGRDLYLNVLLAGLNGQREVSEYLRSIGIPGHKYLDGTSRSAGEGSYNYVIYDDQAVRIAKTYYQGQQAAAFYSQLERVLSAKLSNGTAAQHLKTLDAWVKKGEFKGEELEWSGLREWLAGRGDQKTSKEEVLDFLRQGGVKVEEVVKRGVADDAAQGWGALRVIGDEDNGFFVFSDDFDREVAGPFTDVQDAESEMERIGNESDWTSDSDNATKFSQYQLPGGENYHELLLTLPKAERPQPMETTTGWRVETTDRNDYTGQRDIKVYDAEGNWRGTRSGFRGTDEEAIASYAGYRQQENTREAESALNFTSPHFSEPNILAHVRFNERTDAEGKRVLFIEEIQSDWAQEGRKEGFSGPIDTTGWEALPSEFSKGVWDVYDAEGRGVWNGPAQDASAALRRATESKSLRSIPDAPFVKNTSAWSMLAMKRMIRWAAENGFDKVAWTTGEQQAERYDLSKQVSKVALDDAGTLQVQGLNGEMVLTEKNVTKEKAADIVGKEVADKLFAQDAKKANLTEEGFGYSGGKDKHGVVLSGLDLKVGGEGMKGFYDKILPNETNKLIKKWGAKVGETRIAAGDVSPVGAQGSWQFLDADGEEIAVVHSKMERDALEEELDEQYGPGSAGLVYEIRDISPKGRIAVHSFDITPAMREGAMAGQALFQGQASGPRGSVTFNRHETVVRLFKGAADLSTFLHETGHIFVRDLEDLAATGRAPEQVVKDLETLKAFAGDLSTTEAQEKLARAFEAYLMEGKAPSLELRSAFQRFRAWLTAIYRSARQGLGVDLTNEVRGVFDRMLAAEDEIAEAEAYYGQKDDLAAVAGDMLTEAEKKRLAGVKAKAHVDALEARVQQYVKAYFAAVGGKAAFEAEAHAEISARPVYAATDQALAEGGIPKAALVDLVGEQKAAEIARKRVGLVRLEADLDLEQLAVAHGFENAAEWAQTMLDAPSKRQAVLALTQEKMAAKEQTIRAEFDGQVKPGDEGYHSAERLEVLLAENKILERKARGKALAEQSRPARLTAQAVREVAYAAVRGMTTKQARDYRAFAVAEAKASQKAMQAAKAGDWEEAARQKQREALNHAMVLEAVAARREQERSVARVRKIAKSKNLEFQFREQILGLLQRYGLGTPAMAPTRADELVGLREFVAAVSADDIFEAPVWPDWLLDGQKAGDPNALTQAELAEVVGMVKWLAGEGGAVEHTEMLTEPGATVGAKVEELIHALEESGNAAKVHEEGTVRGKVVEAKRDLLAALNHQQFMFMAADGYKEIGAKASHKKGPHSRLFAKVMEALNGKLLDLRADEQALKPIEAVRYEFVSRFKKAYGEGAAEINGVPVPAVMRLAGRSQWTAERIWALARNMGNAGNLKTLIEGYGLNEGNLLALTSILTEKEWRAVQAEWDLAGKDYQRSDQTHRMIYHVPMGERVAAQPLLVVTADNGNITLPGGYFPIAVDRKLNVDIADRQARDIIKGDPAFTAFGPSVRKGFTNQRTGTARPVDLSFGVLQNALMDRAHFNNVAPVVRDLDRLTRDKAWRAAYTAAFGAEAYDEVRAWLKHLAKPTIEQRDTVDSFFDKQRQLSTMFILGFNASSFLRQFMGYFPAAQELGWKWIVKGIARYGMAPLEMVKDIRDRSPFLADREKGLDADWREALYRMKTKHSVKIGDRVYTRKDIHRFSMALLQFGDRLTTYPIWQGAYTKGVEELGLGQKEAVAFADGIVQKTQTSGTAADLVRWQRKGGMMRLFTMFMSEALRKGSRMRYYAGALANGKIGVGEYTSHLLHEAVFPAVVYTMVKAALSDDTPEKEDFFLAVWNELAGIYPLVSQLSAYFQYGRSPAASPAFAGIDTALKAVKKGAGVFAEPASGEAWAGLFKAMVDVTAFGLGAGNLRRVYETAAEGWRDLEAGDTHNPFRLFYKKPKDD